MTKISEFIKTKSFGDESIYTSNLLRDFIVRADIKFMHDDGGHQYLAPKFSDLEFLVLLNNKELNITKSIQCELKSDFDMQAQILHAFENDICNTMDEVIDAFHNQDDIDND